MTLVGHHGNVVVIGGGLAGISAAIDLAEAGLEVSLIEARPWLGGATCSFARRGLTIDNGQHLFLRCCTAYRDLLAKLGVTSYYSIQERLDLTVLGPDDWAQLRRSALPAPFHLARSLAGYRLLSPLERIKVAAAASFLQLGALSGYGREEASLGDWLSRRLQSEHARRMFWDLLSVSALNVDSDHADPGLAASAIMYGVLARRNAADICVPLVPLRALHADPAADLLTRLGATVRLGVKAVAVRTRRGGGYDIRLGYDGESGGVPIQRGPTEISAAGVVLAVPAWSAATLGPAEMSADTARWAMLQPSPVISIHVVYASRVTRLPFAAVVGSNVHWLIDKTRAAGLHTGQYLALSVPAADRYVDAPASQLREEFLELIACLFPAARSACVDDVFVTRERRATIRHVPGTERARLQSMSLPGLAVAGAWTDTGWPDTMEGAVRSGHSAAQKVIADMAASGGGARPTVPGCRPAGTEVAATASPVTPGSAAGGTVARR